MDAFSLNRRLCAEGIGSFFLVATVVGSGIMAESLTDDIALALLGNTLPTGAILVVLITILGPISGAHFNPAVTLAFAATGGLAKGWIAPYIIAQVLGGILGTWAAHGMFDQPILQFSDTLRTGPAQWMSEGIATFGLVFTIFLGVRFKADAIPVLVGLYITAAYWFTASTSFANPAVTISRMFTDTFSGINPVDVPAFVMVQIIGAIGAAFAARFLLRRSED